MLARKNVVLLEGIRRPTSEPAVREQGLSMQLAQCGAKDHNELSLPAGWVVAYFTIPQAEFCQVRFSKCGIGIMFWDIIAILWFNGEDVLGIKYDICIQLTLWMQWMVVKHFEIPVFLLPVVVFCFLLWDCCSGIIFPHMTCCSGVIFLFRCIEIGYTPIFVAT